LIAIGQILDSFYLKVPFQPDRKEYEKKIFTELLQEGLVNTKILIDWKRQK